MFPSSANCNKIERPPATQEALSISILAHMPLTKWNLIKAELVEMWRIVNVTGLGNPIAA
jgi:hypothetical protein